jgi:glucose-6-phosphate isomerase, archaeal
MIEQPFATRILPAEHRLDGAESVSSTTLGSLANSFADRNAATAGADRVVYRVSRRDVPAETGELLQCITEILPGDCGGELFMTRGHGHARAECAEIYLGVSGRGLVLMQKGDEFRAEEIDAYRAVYIPGGWNHRTVNTSAVESLAFYSVWPAQSGYDYGAIARMPYSYRAYAEGDGYRLVEAR